MPDPATAYEAARQEIARARAAGETRLGFFHEAFRALDHLPPEIAEFAELTHLDLQRTQVKDLTPIAGLIKLEQLSLDRTAVHDLSALTGLTALASLGLNHTAIRDLSPLAGLSSLQVLGISRTAVQDFTPLAGIAELQALGLAQTAVSDLSPLADLTALTFLDLDQTMVEDLRPIRDLPQLGEGPLSGLRFRDTPAVARDAELRRLSEIEDSKQRTRETLAYLKTLPRWPEPLPWEAAAAARKPAVEVAPKVQAARAQIQALMRHPLVTRITAAQFADQIEAALQGLPTEEGNRLAEPFQTMLEFAEVLRKLAPARHTAPAALHEHELRIRIRELEESVARLTVQLAASVKVRGADETLAKRSAPWEKLQGAAAESLGKETGPIVRRLVTMGGLAAAVYFLGVSHPLVEALQDVADRYLR